MTIEKLDTRLDAEMYLAENRRKIIEKLKVENRELKKQLAEKDQEIKKLKGDTK